MGRPGIPGRPFLLAIHPDPDFIPKYRANVACSIPGSVGRIRLIEIDDRPRPFNTGKPGFSILLKVTDCHLKFGA
jgi:hypothetical protein